MSGPFGGLSISEKKKSVISDVALCVLCMWVLHGDLQVIHRSIFNCFPYCIVLGVCEYKSGRSFTIIPQVVVFIFVCCVEVLRPNQSHWVMSSAVSLPNHTSFTGQA